MNYSDLITLILTQLRTHVNSDQFLEQFRTLKSICKTPQAYIKAGSCLSQAVLR